MTYRRSVGRSVEDCECNVDVAAISGLDEVSSENRGNNTCNRVINFATTSKLFSILNSEVKRS